MEGAFLASLDSDPLAQLITFFYVFTYRRRGYIFELKCSDGPGLNFPQLSDPSGLYVRRDGLLGHYLVSRIHSFRGFSSYLHASYISCKVVEQFLTVVEPDLKTMIDFFSKGYVVP